MSNPSLILPQSPAYGEDYVYAAQVNDGVVPLYNVLPLTFTRASNGTRINKDGILENMPYNLVEYSEDFTNAYWTKNRSSITANSTTAPNGTTTADSLIEDTANGTHEIITILNNETQIYNFSAYAKANTRTKIALVLAGAAWSSGGNGQVIFNLNDGTIVSTSGGATGSIESVGNGWFRCTIYKQATASSAGAIPVIQLVDSSNNTSYTGNGTSGAFVWGAQLNIGSTAKPYLATTDRLNMPRITYPVGGGCGALLLEKQSTNLVTYSEQFDNGDWSLTGVNITANNITSPDGTQNADLFSSTSSAGMAYQVKTLSGAHTLSAFFKVGTSALARVQFYDAGVGTSAVGIYNLNTLNVSTTGLSSTGTITNYGNGWYRCTLTASLSGSAINCFVGLDENAKNIYVYGAQLEASSYATSYIPTTSTSATRIADACYKTGISNLIGQTQGTIYMDFIYLGGVQAVAIELSNSASADDIINLYITSTAQTQCYMFDGGSQVGFINSSHTFVQGSRYKVAIGYASNDLVLYINGTQIGTATPSSIPTTSEIYISRDKAASYLTATKYNEAIIYQTRLTNAELQALTS